MSVKLNVDKLNNIQELPQNAKTLIFEFLDKASLEKFKQASSATWTNVTNYKIDEISLPEIKNFIEVLLEGLDPIKHIKERGKLEKIKTKIEVKTLSNGLPMLSPNVFIIRKLIIGALKSLDKPAVDSLKSNSTPRYFKDAFKTLELFGEINSQANQIPATPELSGEINSQANQIRATLELFGEINSQVNQIPALPNAVKNGDLDIVIEVVNLMHPEIRERNEAYSLIAQSLIIDGEFDKASEVANLISNMDMSDSLMLKITASSSSVKPTFS